MLKIHRQTYILFLNPSTIDQNHMIRIVLAFRYNTYNHTSTLKIVHLSRIYRIRLKHQLGYCYTICEHSDYVSANTNRKDMTKTQNFL